MSYSLREVQETGLRSSILIDLAYNSLMLICWRVDGQDGWVGLGLGRRCIEGGGGGKYERRRGTAGNEGNPIRSLPSSTNEATDPLLGYTPSLSSHLPCAPANVCVYVNTHTNTFTNIHSTTETCRNFICIDTCKKWIKRCRWLKTCFSLCWPCWLCWVICSTVHRL